MIISIAVLIQISDAFFCLAYLQPSKGHLKWGNILAYIRYQPVSSTSKWYGGKETAFIYKVLVSETAHDQHTSEELSLVPICHQEKIKMGHTCHSSPQALLAGGMTVEEIWSW